MSVTETDKEKFNKSFYGAVDRAGGRSDGRVVSQLPAWRHKKGIEDMKEELAGIERKLKYGGAHPEEKPYLDVERKNIQNRYDAIMKSKPAFTAFEKKKMEKEYKELGENIRESLFTRDQMWTRKADAHKELARMKTPCVKVPQYLADLGDVKLVNGKAPRDKASKLWATAGDYLDADTNPENLRRLSDYTTGPGRSNSVVVPEIPWHKSEEQIKAELKAELMAELKAELSGKSKE